MINLLLILHVDRRQRSITDRELTFLEANEYSFMMFAYYTGSFISRSTLHSSILTKAFTPTLVQMVNMVLWIYNI